VLITGSGRAFSAGGDLIEFERALQGGGSQLLDTLRYNQDVLQLVEDLPVPVIGVANGVAVAGGLELLLCCDMIIAAAGVKIGDGHARYGIVPAGGATVRLLERLRPSRAAQLLYTAALVESETLAEWGLVNEVVPKERLMARAMEVAREICTCSPEVLRHIKSLTRRSAHDGQRAGRLLAELGRFETHIGGADLKEGLSAFRAKRQPAYRDER